MKREDKNALIEQLTEEINKKRYKINRSKKYII